MRRETRERARDRRDWRRTSPDLRPPGCGCGFDGVGFAFLIALILVILFG